MTALIQTPLSTHQIKTLSALVGLRWSDFEEDATLKENCTLWRQCGEIVRQIHATTGESFGYPYPGRSFNKWSKVVLDRRSKIHASMQTYRLDATVFSS